MDHLSGARFLYKQHVDDVVGRIVQGQISNSEGRNELREVLQDLGYTPEGGFPDEETNLNATKGQSDNSGDISSFAHLNTLLNTRVSQAHLYRRIQRWKDEFIRDEWPAWELVSFGKKQTHRGFKRRNGKLVCIPENGWPARWVKAGGHLYCGRMVALVDDLVWSRLGSRELFRDGLGMPYPPFAFNSSYSIEAISRDEAISIGVYDGTFVPGMPAGVR